VNTPAEVAAAGQLACLLEVSAPKPGNVSPARHFHDTRYEDFLASAVAIGPALFEAARQPLGVTIRTAVENTRRWTRSNTNLGIVLLLAPVARAALSPGGTLRERLGRVLAATTVDDAAPSVTLRDAMRLAAERDAIAREYVSDFALTFDIGVPALRAARADGMAWSDAAVDAYLRLLHSTIDTHIARKLGRDEARLVSERAGEVLTAGGIRTDEGRRALARHYSRSHLCCHIRRYT
jgi:triphosphoribosyl-dephospho-CoA synthase